MIAPTHLNSGDRKRANANSVFPHCHDGARTKLRARLFKHPKQQVSLLGGLIQMRNAQMYKRRPRGGRMGEERCKVAIARHNQSAVGACVGEDGAIVGCRHAELSYVHCIAACFTKLLGQLGGQRGVDEQLQLFDASGSSLSRTASAA